MSEQETITVLRKKNGWIIIYDNYDNIMRYLYHTKRYAIRNFKEAYGYRYKRGIVVKEITE